MKIHIYVIKNIINNKIYIGSTKNIISRKYYHFNQLKNNHHHSKHLQNAYNKYDKNNFIFYIIEECNEINRYEREVYHININNSYKKEYGYNLYKPSIYGFTCSDETRIKLRNSNYNKSVVVAIDMYDLFGNFINSFSSYKECKLLTNINTSITHGIINKKRKSYKGYTFVLKGQPFTYKPSNKQRNMTNYYK